MPRPPDYSTLLRLAVRPFPAALGRRAFSYRPGVAGAARDSAQCAPDLTTASVETSREPSAINSTRPGVISRGVTVLYGDLWFLFITHFQWSVFRKGDCFLTRSGVVSPRYSIDRWIFNGSCCYRDRNKSRFCLWKVSRVVLSEKIELSNSLLLLRIKSACFHSRTFFFFFKT